MMGSELNKTKIEQVAIYSKDPEKLKKALKILGCTEWSVDHVIAEGTVRDIPALNSADLHFNYQLGDFEFEILEYKNGTNWHDQDALTHGVPATPFMSHLGVHVRSVDAVKIDMKRLGFKVAQEVKTVSHTNPHIAGKRKYRYVIFDTLSLFGFYFKAIERIDIVPVPAPDKIVPPKLKFDDSEELDGMIDQYRIAADTARTVAESEVKAQMMGWLSELRDLREDIVCKFY
jgi:hypothetical protein